jgi:hypothetical protein
MSRLTRFMRSRGLLPGSARQERILPLQWPGFPVAVCWSAKSGCTTILKWFLAHNGLLDEALAHSSWVHDYRQERLFVARDYGRQCDRLFEQGRGDTAVLVVKVIRDPATRAVSSFLHFLRASGGATFWSGASVVDQWKRTAGLARQPGLSFRQFLRFVAARQARRPLLDIHFRPQYDPTQDPRVDTFLRLEDLAAGLEEIEDRRGLSHVDVNPFSSARHHNPPSSNHAWPDLAAAFAADTPTLHALGTPPAKAFLDQETRALIRTAYRVDYEAYGHAYDSSPACRPTPAEGGRVGDLTVQRPLRRTA